MNLKKSNANKIITYILNSRISIENFRIKKIDKYTLFFEVKL